MVVQLAAFSSRDTVAVLKCLLDEAEKGEIVGMAILIQGKGGDEQSFFTGRFKVPAQAAHASLRLLRLMQG